jgi:hypothetical protein
VKIFPITMKSLGSRHPAPAPDLEFKTIRGRSPFN